MVLNFHIQWTKSTEPQPVLSISSCKLKKVDDFVVCIRSHVTLQWPKSISFNKLFCKSVRGGPYNYLYRQILWKMYTLPNRPWIAKDENRIIYWKQTNKFTGQTYNLNDLKRILSITFPWSKITSSGGDKPYLYMLFIDLRGTIRRKSSFTMVLLWWKERKTQELFFLTFLMLLELLMDIIDRRNYKKKSASSTWFPINVLTSISLNQGLL